jgi:flagella basal body P-ring formation protein FlgA
MRLIRVGMVVCVMLAGGSAANGQPVQSLTGQVVGGQSVAARNSSNTMPAEAARDEEVWEPTRALIPGDIIRREDIAARMLSRPNPEAVPASQDIVGQQIKRHAAADRPLTIRDVGPRTVVQANSPVTVHWSSGTLKMELSARAMENGALGEEIHILNTSSGRTIRGIVVGDGMIEVKADQ